MFPPPFPIMCEWSVYDTSIFRVTLLDWEMKDNNIIIINLISITVKIL